MNCHNFVLSLCGLLRAPPQPDSVLVCKPPQGEHGASRSNTVPYAVHGVPQGCRAQGLGPTEAAARVPHIFSPTDSVTAHTGTHLRWRL